MLNCKNVSISFGKKQVLKNFSLNLAKQQRLAIIGRNGSGKTTLALFLAGVIPEFVSAKTTGKITVPKKTSLVLQNPSSQFFSLTVKGELAGIETTGWGIEHLLSKNVFELSEGEKQKVNLIANLHSKPELLMLDEPLELLDPIQPRAFEKEILKIKDTSIIWFDKNQDFVKNWPKKFVCPEEKVVFSKKKNSALGKTVLNANFKIERTGFELSENFSVQDGEKIGLIGENGSGKTTLLKAFSGMEKINGKLDLKQKTNFAPQNPSYLFFQESVAAEVIEKANLKLLGIEYLQEKDPVKLSKGQQKMVSVATIEPNTIGLLDEPTTWLDDHNKKAVYDFVNNSKQAMVIATHDRKLLDYCDRVFLVEKEKGVCECSNTAVNRFFLV